jgi:hypothetical protein
LSTDEVFVSLNFDSTSNRRDTFSNKNILEAGNRIRVVGDPGSGKSSLVKRLYRDLCRLGAANPRNAQIPVWLELRDLGVPKNLGSKGDKTDWLLKHLRDRVAAVEGHKMSEFFDDAVRQSGVVILLDGLDEVSTEAYFRTAELIRLLSQRLGELGPTNAVILTMRVQFHQQVYRDFDQDFPVTLYVRPFTPSDIYEFLTRWFRGSEEKHFANSVYAELAARPNLRDMCTNPLVLAMYTANYRSVAFESDLPDTRAEFYQAVVDELLVKRRSRQLSDRTGRLARRDDRYRIFGQIAYDNLLDYGQSANSASWSRALEIVKKVTGQASDKKAAELLRILAKETGIFTEERPNESIRFIHLTFCEYLAAVEAVKHREDGWHALAEAHRRANLHSNSSAGTRLLEVITFACTLVPLGRREQVLNDVFALGNHELYAKCVVETQNYGHDRWPDYLREERAALTSTPYSAWNEDWLTRLHLYQTAVLEQRAITNGQCGKRPSVDQLFADLVGDSRDRLIRLFSMHSADNPSGAFLLAETCGLDLISDAPDLLQRECANPLFLSHCLELARKDTMHFREWCDIFSRSAMESRLVAETLSSEVEPLEWRGHLEAVEKRYRWDAVLRAEGVHRSIYGTAISVALEDLGPTRSVEKSSTRRDGALVRLSSIRSPGRALPTGVSGAFGLLLICLAIIFPLLVLGNSVRSTNGLAVPFTAMGSFLLLVMGASCLWFACYRRRLYRTLTNLDLLTMRVIMYEYQSAGSPVRTLLLLSRRIFLPPGQMLIAPNLNRAIQNIDIDLIHGEEI